MPREPSKGSIASFSTTAAAVAGFLEDGSGLVSMEAEHNQANVPVGNYAWMPVTNSGYTGSGALQILPDDGPNPAIAGAGPRLDYQVQFTKTGTHYIWIRALSNSFASDSLYVGLDGGTAGAVYMIALNQDGRTWTWSNQAKTGVRWGVQRHLYGRAHGQCMDAGIRHRAGQTGAEHQRELRPHRHGPRGECKHRRCPDGDDERGHLHNVHRRHGERGREPERRCDDRLVRVGHQPDPYHLQQHFHAGVGVRDDEPGGHGGAVGVESPGRRTTSVWRPPAPRERRRDRLPVSAPRRRQRPRR